MKTLNLVDLEKNVIDRLTIFNNKYNNTDNYLSKIYFGAVSQAMYQMLEAIQESTQEV